MRDQGDDELNNLSDLLDQIAGSTTSTPNSSPDDYYDDEAEPAEDNSSPDISPKQRSVEQSVYFWQAARQLVEEYAALPGMQELEETLYQHMYSVIHGAALVIKGKPITEYVNTLDGLNQDFLNVLVATMFRRTVTRKPEINILGQARYILQSDKNKSAVQELDSLPNVIELSDEFWTHNKGTVENLLERIAQGTYSPNESLRILLTRVVFLKHIFIGYVNYLDSLQ